MTQEPDRRLVISALAATAAGSLATPGPAAARNSDQNSVQGSVQRPGYLLVTGRSFDPARVRQYGAALPPVYASAGGYYLGIGGQGRGVEWIEGPWRDRSLVLAVFPDRAAVETFWWSPAYRAAVPLRDRAGVFTVSALEGLGPVPHQGAGSAYLVTLLASGSDARRTGAAADAYRTAVARSGGTLMTSTDAGAPLPLEGDSAFDRVWIAGWADAAGRSGFLASQAARSARRLREAAGFSVVATLNGIPRPPAQTPAAGPQPTPGPAASQPGTR